MMPGFSRLKLIRARRLCLPTGMCERTPQCLWSPLCSQILLSDLLSHPHYLHDPRTPLCCSPGVPEGALSCFWKYIYPYSNLPLTACNYALQTGFSPLASLVQDQQRHSTSNGCLCATLWKSCLTPPFSRSLWGWG